MGDLRRIVALLRRESARIPRRGVAIPDPLVSYPNDGTFSRTSPATWWGKAGPTLKRYIANELRQPSKIVGRPAYVIEGARTNYLANSNDHDAASWATSGVTISPDNPGDPSGGSQRDEINYDVSLGSFVRELGTAVPVSVNGFISGFARREGTWINAVTQLREVNHNSVVTNNPFEPDTFWERQAFDVGDTGTPDAGNIQFVWRNGAAEARTLSVFGSQYEAGAFASSLIETSGGAATRAQDLLTIPFASVPAALYEGPYEFWIQPRFSSAEFVAAGAAADFISGSSAQYARFRIATGVANVRVNNGAGAFDSATTTWDAWDILKIILWPVEGRFRLEGFNTGNGDYYGGAGAWTNTNDIVIGRQPTNTNPFYGLITEPYDTKEFDELDQPAFRFEDTQFARASAATYWDADKREFFRWGPNEKRLFKFGLDDFPYVILEGARTNYVNPSNNHAPGSGWAPTNTTVVTDAEDAPDGIDRSEVCQHTSSGSARISRTVAGSMPDNVDLILSGFGKRVGSTWTSTPRPGIQFRDRAGNTTVIAEEFENTGNWDRIASAPGQLNSASGGSSPDFRFRNNTGEARDVSYWGAQCEEGLFPSTPIETAGAVATRSADDMSIATNQIKPEFFTAPFFFYVRFFFDPAQYDADGGAQNLLVMAGGTGSIFLRKQGPGDARIRLVTAGGNVNSDTITWTPGAQLQIAANPTTGELGLSGFDSGNGLKQSAGGAWTGGILQVGANASVAGNLFGAISEPYLFDGLLSAFDEGFDAGFGI